MSCSPHPAEERTQLSVTWSKLLLALTWAQKFSQVVSGNTGRTMGSLLRCVGWVCLAFLAALLTDVCIAQPGKTLGFTAKFVSEISGEQRVPFFLFLRQGSNGVGSEEFRLLALTIATDETDGYKRFMRSAKANNIDVKVFVNYSCSYIKRVISCTAVCFRRKFLATW